MESKTLFMLALALAAGLFMSRLTKKFGLPSVTAYLVAGLLVGPYVIGNIDIDGLGFVSSKAVEQFNIVSDVALGFIAFSIGNEFRLSQLKQIGGKATFIGIWQAIFTTALVDIVLVILHFFMKDKLPISMCLILGAIAAATAPATTLMVVKQYKAQGKITDLLLPIVAIDDAVGLIVFALSFGIAKSLETGEFNVIGIVVNPLIEIAGSLLLGCIIGVLFTISEKMFSSNSKRLSLSIMFILLTVGLTQLGFSYGELEFGFSPLLTCMMMGTMFCNLCDFSPEIMDKTDRWSQPVLILFFVLSGAALRLDVFTKPIAVAIGCAYIISRTIGKYYGAYTSSKLTHCDDKTKKYLGVTLFPQEGVALGMTLTVMKYGEAVPEFSSIASLVRSIVLFSVLVYELTAPIMTKIALTKAGEITTKPEHKERKNKQAPAKI